MAYEAMYGIADNLSSIVHVDELINAELQMFGAIPTLIFQQFYRNTIFDYVGAIFYSLHFIVPSVFGFILWRHSPKNYWEFTLAFLLCSYSALITFMMYPSAPPWFGVKASRILFQVDREMGVPVYATIFDYIQPNPFAAFPSLHAAYPWLISLYALKFKRIKSLPVLLFPIGVWFSAVYLGEHYIVDILGGVVYSTCSFLLVEKVISRL
jgi:membrane-associated phospholipid phosphatase